MESGRLVERSGYASFHFLYRVIAVKSLKGRCYLWATLFEPSFDILKLCDGKFNLI
jgi:hypothetical protein